MPYAFAHPAAAVPLRHVLGRFAVPSALVIGSLVPDLWYVMPLLDRPHTHRASGLLWFCLPAGLIAYAAFHTLLKHPLAALLPQRIHARLQPCLAAGQPQRLGLGLRRWAAIVASLVAGSATHLLWDALTHKGIVSRHLFPGLNATFALGPLEPSLLQILQHGSTLAGTAFLVWWCGRWLRRTAPAPVPPTARLSRLAHAGVLCGAACAGLIALFVSFDGASHGALTHGVLSDGSLEALRPLFKNAAATAIASAGAVLGAYCVLWQLSRRPGPRASCLPTTPPARKGR
ncbi:MAG TPA: DUF4184 family protein [Burkholderiales bacterium]|nr:DUF4184 family protein [Burkholderiales bacterium]